MGARCLRRRDPRQRQALAIPRRRTGESTAFASSTGRTRASCAWRCRTAARSRKSATDQGLLPAPVSSTMLTLAPAERVDVVVDFAALAARCRARRTTAMPIMQFRAPPRPDDRPECPARQAATARTRRRRARHDRRTHMLGEVQDLPRTADADAPEQHAVARCPSPSVRRSVRRRSGIWRTSQTTRIRFTCTSCGFRSSTAGNSIRFSSNHHDKHRASRVPRAARGRRGRLEGHRPRRPGHDHAHHRQFDGYAGCYMWHCHMLEHGDNEMMRPLEIVPAGRPPPVSG